MLEECTWSIELTALQKACVVDMINRLSDPTRMRAQDLGGDRIKLEFYQDRNTRTNYQSFLTHLLYTIPLLLGLKTVVVDVNNKIGLYEYVLDKYLEHKYRKETAVKKPIEEPNKPEGDWPDFSLDSHAI